MTTTHIEQEATFEGPGVLDPALLRRVPGVARVRAEEPEELDAVYYDTADLRLLAHGITLRRRGGGHDEGWHLKLPGAGGERLELHVPPGGTRPAGVPAELYRGVAAYARGAELTPVAHVRTHRTRHSMLDERGRRLAEVAQDEVDAQILGTERLRPGRPAPEGAPVRSGGTSTRLSHWSEVEIETDAGDAKLLRAAARELRAAGWRPSPHPRKLGHALAPVLPPDFGPVPPVNAWGRGSAGEAVATRLRDQVRVLLSLDAAVRADEPDAVHRMRSTARRLRSLLRGHRRLLDRGRTEPVAAELRRLTRALGPARDHEVLAERLYDQGRALRGPADPGFAALLRDEERARHAEGRRAAVAALDSRRFAALLDALEDLVNNPPLREGRARKPAAEHLSKAAAGDRRRLKRRMAAVRRAEPGPERDRALHSARKAARRARHTAETAEPYGGKRAKRLRKRTKALQGLLGEHQDAVVARAELLDLAARARAAGQDTYAHGRLHALQDRLALEARAALPAAWRRARKRKLVRFA
ncbi:CYTH and CHAD domain-containing protein [Streptomyces sp. HPF1205]|uniref:CYTH and CHAD domain-containing protein n=1 Tax=Streptomyces sp. HPF1205 TaxID=2873262 RepID=UPI001CEC3984|nr:CYTH and CHAD domain-containing protein [Streptomyces sp. HPF1205]